VYTCDEEEKRKMMRGRVFNKEHVQAVIEHGEKVVTDACLDIDVITSRGFCSLQVPDWRSEKRRDASGFSRRKAIGYSDIYPIFAHRHVV
jgi:hypothetical protein